LVFSLVCVHHASATCLLMAFRRFQVLIKVMWRIREVSVGSSKCLAASSKSHRVTGGEAHLGRQWRFAIAIMP
jgi:hypothetical protein